MKTGIIAFTKKGCDIGLFLSIKLENCTFSCSTGEDKVDFREWTKNAFENYDNIIFISAVGIAVRAISPYVKSKTTDPAVIVIDDNAKYCIPILSGHIGGANEMALRISEILKSQPIITTSTDINNVWAVDTWGKKHGFEIKNTGKIKVISSKLLNNEKVYLYSDYEIEGTLPKNVLLTKNKADCDISISIYKAENALCLVPKIVTVGIGCKKGTSLEAIENLYINALSESNIFTESVRNIASIDIKKDELGLIDFAEKINIPITFYTAEELSKIEGDFSKSSFVKSVTGVDNVCERSALLSSKDGEIIIRKTAQNGVAFSAANDKFTVKF